MADGRMEEEEAAVHPSLFDISTLCENALDDLRPRGFQVQSAYLRQLTGLVSTLRAAVARAAPVHALPDEALRRILASVTDPRALFAASLVCRRWNRVLDSDDLWGVVYARIWPDAGVGQDPYCPPGAGWRERFRRRWLCQANWLRGECRVRECARHDDLVTCVQFRGTTLISGSRDRSMREWDLSKPQQREPVRHIEGHQRTLFRLQYDDDRLVSCSRDCSVRIWNRRTGHCDAVLQGHEAEVTCVQFDDDKIISGSRDRSIRVWDWAGELVAVLEGHDRGVGCLQFLGDMLISGAGDNLVKIWDVPSRTCLHSLEGHTDKVLCLQFRGKRLVTGSKDSTIHVWNLDTLEAEHILKGHQSWVHCLEFNDDRIVSGANDYSIKVWSTHTWECLFTLQRHRNTVRCLQIDDWRIISGSFDGTCIEWDFAPPPKDGAPARGELLPGGCLPGNATPNENDANPEEAARARVHVQGYDPFAQRYTANRR